MFLSNPCKSFLLIAICIALLQACSGSQPKENKDISLNGETKSEFPFSTKEPEVYQGDLATTSGDIDDHYFVARKGDKWRYDVFRGSERAMSEIHSDKLYGIDHQKRTYWEISGQTGGTSNVNDMTRNFFRGHEYHDFDEAGREGSLIKYKVRNSGDTKGNVIVTVDSTSGMVIKQEFMSLNKQTPDFVYEIRNLKMEVEDSVFDIPQGYKKVVSK